MTTTETPAPYKTFTVRIAATGPQFPKAVQRAKRYDGVFDAQTKTWTIKLWAGGILEGAEAQGVAAFLQAEGLALVED